MIQLSARMHGNNQRTILSLPIKAYENEAIIEKLEELETVISIDNKDI